MAAESQAQPLVTASSLALAQPPPTHTHLYICRHKHMEGVRVREVGEISAHQREAC